MGDELKNKILEHNGIKIAEGKAVSVQRTCGRCGYVNKLENKYCERNGCNYPLTELAFQEIKAAEQAKLQELINQSNLERDKEIQSMQEELRFFKNQFEGYREIFGPRPLTKFEREKIERLREQLKNIPDNNDTYDAD